jgi:predicted transcriptional regulator
VWFDLYLDNSTNDPAKMKMISLSEDNYKQTFYTIVLQFEENMTYYWYVIPHLKTDDGSITGICQSGVVYFSFGAPDKIYLMDLELENKELTVEPGTQRIVRILIKNLGNQESIFDITTEVSGTDKIVANPDLKIVVMDVGESQYINLNILTLLSAEEGVYPINIKVTARESTVVYDIDTIIVTVSKYGGGGNGNNNGNGNGSDGDGEENKEDDIGYFFNMEMFASIIVVAVIFLLISAFLYTTIKRHRLLEHQRREAIYNYIKEHPGDHFRSIMNELNLEVGTLSYHVNKLESEGYIKSRQDGMYRRFYSIDAKIDGRLILSELQERILNFIKSNPGITGSNIANQFGMDRKIIRYHVGVLEKLGIIYTEKSGREMLCFSTSGA